RDGSAGVEIPLHRRVLSRLGDGRRPQRDRDVLKGAALNVSRGIDAVALDELAAAGHELVGRVERERAVSGVKLLVPLDEEEPIAIDGHVGGLAGRLDGPGGEVLLVVGDDHTLAFLARVGAAEVAGGRRSIGVGDVKLRRKERPGALEGGGVGIGNVVANHVQPLLIDVDPRRAGEQGAGQSHRRSSLLANRRDLHRATFYAAAAAAEAAGAGPIDVTFDIGRIPPLSRFRLTPLVETCTPVTSPFTGLLLTSSPCTRLPMRLDAAPICVCWAKVVSVVCNWLLD